MLQNAIGKNVDQLVASILEVHERKLQIISLNKVLPVTYDELVTNLSQCNMPDDEMELLKNGLDFAIEPRVTNKTDVFTSFQKLNRLLTKEIKDEEVNPDLKTEMSHLARNYYSTYKLSRVSLTKHGIMKMLPRNKDIIIVKPDKGNGLIILDRVMYNNSLSALICDVSKFRKLRGDETIKRERELQRFFRKLKKEVFLMNVLMNRFSP